MARNPPGLGWVRPHGTFFDPAEPNEPGAFLAAHLPVTEEVLAPAPYSDPTAQVPHRRGDLVVCQHLIDIVVWRSERRWLRTGEGEILGEQFLAAADPDMPLAVFGNPELWLAHGGSGVCLLRWRGLRHMWPFASITCVSEEPEFAARLDRALNPRHHAVAWAAPHLGKAA